MMDKGYPSTVGDHAPGTATAPLRSAPPLATRASSHPAHGERDSVSPASTLPPLYSGAASGVPESSPSPPHLFSEETSTALRAHAEAAMKQYEGDDDDWDGAPDATYDAAKNAIQKHREAPNVPTTADRVGVHIEAYILSAIYGFVREGMEVEKACYLVELDDNTIDALLSDENFLKRIRFEIAKGEYDQLNRVHKVARRSERLGSSTEARWLLSKMNRARWGGSTGEVDGGMGDVPRPNIGEAPARKS